jgi:hypothetical protein
MEHEHQQLNGNDADPTVQAAILAYHMGRAKRAENRVATLEDFIRILKYTTPESLRAVRQEAAQLLQESWESDDLSQNENAEAEFDTEDEHPD